MKEWIVPDFKVEKCKTLKCRGIKYYHTNYCYRCLQSEGYDFKTGIMVKKR